MPRAKCNDIEVQYNLEYAHRAALTLDLVGETMLLSIWFDVIVYRVHSIQFLGFSY